MNLTFQFFVDGVKSNRSHTFSIKKGVSVKFLRPYVAKALDDLRKWSINDRIRCNRYIDGMPHEISLHVCGRVVRYDVNRDSFSVTDVLVSKDTGILYAFTYDGLLKSRLLDGYLMPYMDGYISSIFNNNYYDTDTMF